MDEQHTLSKEETLDRLLAAAREGQDKQAETYLPTGYLQGLLSKTSPKPWEYQIVTTVISGGQLLAEKYTHRICNEHGSLMEETGGWEMEGRDPDFELAALSPALAEEVIQSRETIAELKAQLAAVENPDPALEEEVIRLRGIIEDCEKSIAAANQAPAHPEYLETLEDYEGAPVGTILERPNAVASGLYLIKLDALFYQSWKAPGLSGYCIDKDLAGTRRRVIYWPEPEVVE